MIREEFEVVVVGAGPAGLASAVTLGSYGVETLVVERRASSSTLPRATVASTATMELLRRWGLEEKAWERSIDVEWQAWACSTLADADHGHAVEVGLPTREQALLVSPTSPACLAQDELEPLLEEHLGSVESVRARARRRTRRAGTRERRRPRAHARRPRQRRRRVRARYVIGADGVRSSVREALRDPVRGRRERCGTPRGRVPGPGLGARPRAPLRHLLPRRAAAASFPPGKPDRWVFGMDWDAHSRAADALTTEQITRWIRDAVRRTRSADRDRARDAGRVRDRSRRAIPRGRRLPCRRRSAPGDPARRHRPQHGDPRRLRHRLETRLGSARLGRRARCSRATSASAGRSPSSIRSAPSRADGSILDTAVGLNADIGGRIAHVWVPRDGHLVSTLDLLGDGLTLFLGPDADDAMPSGEACSPPVTTVRLDAIAARGLGLSPDGTLLARPDGFPVQLRNAQRPAVLSRLLPNERSSLLPLAGER